MIERISFQPFTAEWRRKQVAANGPNWPISTFRKGPKWLRAELVGQRVELFDEGTQSVFATAKVFSVKLCAFEDLDAWDWDRQTSDLVLGDGLEIMRKVYGEYELSTPTCVITLSDVEITHDLK